MTQDEMTVPKSSGRGFAFLYVAFVAAIVVLLGTSLVLVRVRGGFAYPAYFNVFRILFYVQFGLFGGALLSALLYLLPPSRLPVAVSAVIFGAFHFWAAWLFVWGLVQRAYGIELTAGTTLEFFTNPVAAAAMGLEPRDLIVIGAILLVIIPILSGISLYLSSRGHSLLRRRVCLTTAGLFLLFHIPARAYFVYNINRGKHVVLAYDDCAPFPLRSEQFIPGLRRHRVALPDLEVEDRTKKYFEFVSRMDMPAIPRPQNILWIVVESLRFDALDEHVMPRVSAYRDQFQIRLDRHHWSGGNATQFGISSMLTGLSGYHFQKFRHEQIRNPFFVLLSKNGYRLRVSQKHYVQYGGLLSLFPPESVLVELPPGPRDQRDLKSIGLYLEDRANRKGAGPSFDLLPIDATHWPYWFPETHAIFQPATLVVSSTHILRSGTVLETVRNRYRNACHFADEQIARVLDDLQARGGFDDTIVVLVGDHGEEFQERGQITHSAAINDYQGRTLLWMHFPERGPARIPIEAPTVHLDIVPTLLEALGFSEDKLYTQGVSLLGKVEARPALSLCEQGFTRPLYRALVTQNYISRWWDGGDHYFFSGVQRRDGTSVQGDDWLREAKAFYPRAAEMYEVLPDTARPPRAFAQPETSEPAVSSH